MNDANLRVYGATLSYCEDKLNFDIEKAAPQFMQDAFDQLGEIRDFLRGAVRSWRVSEPDGWNHRSIDMSNVEQIAALRTKCEAGQEKIREWMYDVDTPVEEQRKCCGKVVAICLEATHPQLKDYPGFLAYQEKKDKSKK
ncbi:hypothetical protein C9I56_23340 [Paraburkholderia caribensis]|nr:hypothetical protein C9I56_23340 [Paraburkholderia caribensis]